MQSDTTIVRFYVPEKKGIIFCRVQDFHAVNSSALPNVSSSLHGITRQSEVENMSFTDNQLAEEENGVEEQLASALITLHQNHPHAFVSKKTLADPTLPRNFKEACQDVEWREAIDREFNTLFKRDSCKLVPFQPGMKPVPFTWAFRKKPLDVEGRRFLKKAVCCYLETNRSRSWTTIQISHKLKWRLMGRCAFCWHLQLPKCDAVAW